MHLFGIEEFATVFTGADVSNCPFDSLFGSVAQYDSVTIRPFIFLLLAAVAAPVSAFGMDRWSALSMIESGDNDRAVGSRGEVSRFQILPNLWPGGNPRDFQTALTAAHEIMNRRLNRFRSQHRRDATDTEFYILWNAPWQVDHPSPVVQNRAYRFANLVQRS
jgi:hypothetical protein